MKTVKQVEEEIEKLSNIKPTVLRASFFGDNHHDAIDAQIEVLEYKLDEQDIYNNGDDNWAQNVVDAALEAQQWRDDEAEEDLVPSESWKELAR